MEYQLKQRNLTRMAGITSVTLLTILMLLLILPIVPPRVNAEALTNQPASDAIGVDTDVFAKSTVAIAVDSQLELNVPLESVNDRLIGSSYGSANITVMTNNRTGYSLYLQTTSDDGALHNRNSTVEAVISPMERAASLDSADFKPNTWGYSLGGNTYQPIPYATSDIIAATNLAGSVTTHPLKIGVKVDGDLPAGSYHGGVIITALANPLTMVNMEDIESMSEMTPEICANTAENVSKSLKDSDGISYTISRLKDGNCWMTDNIRSSKGQSYYNDNYGGYYTYTNALTVCPTGWQLPTSGTENGSITNMMKAYGMQRSVESVAGEYEFVLPNGSLERIAISNQQFNAFKNPLTFSLGGYVPSYNSSNYDAGSRGLFWTTDPSNTANAYQLDITLSSWAVVTSSDKDFKFNVRCLYRGK